MLPPRSALAQENAAGPLEYKDRRGMKNLSLRVMAVRQDVARPRVEKSASLSGDDDAVRICDSQQ